MKFAAATFLALVALVSAKKHSECGMGAAHHHNHKHHSASSAAHSATISFSSVGGIHTSVAASSSASASVSTSIASSASSTRSTVKVTSTVNASSTLASATTNIAIATSVGVQSPSHAVTRSTVKVTSTVTASSASSTSKAASTTPKATTTKAATSTKPSSSATPTATVIPVSSGSGSNKRGLGFNAVSATLPFAGAVSWAYNWDSQHSGSLAPGAEFVPMLWGTGNDHVSQWTKNAQAAIDAGATHLLGFNEPDLSSQSNLSPQAAAAAWKKYMQPFAGKAKLVSPAVTNGGAPMGTAWLEDFLDECDGCTIDAIAIHIYDSASNVAYFKSYISGVGTKFGKPVWVTEFGASGSVDAQSAFLKQMVPFLNGLASVERFAYFGDFEGTFVQNGKLLPLGKAYATA